MLNAYPHQTRLSSKGAALVITLTLLGLLLGLAIALFLSARVEARSSSAYKDSKDAKELASTAINLVQSQIRDATTSGASNAPSSRGTWASQPGMIRTYAQSSTATQSFKLYSWVNPRSTGDVVDAVPVDWFSTPAQYVDLNEPVADASDPTNPARFRYPIAYPPSGTTNASAGYSVVNAPVASSGAIRNPVPMPVQWLYALQDGTLVYPSESTGKNATIPGASPTNPIVGRIAYWTDDEACKVNLNTAAGGPFWMTPVYSTALEQSFANYQPMQFEFQRFPGHPARTDLRAVFPDLTQNSATNSVYAFAPRIQFGGSMLALEQGSNSSANTSAVLMDSDRLFASVGEGRFTANGTVPRSEFWPAGEWRDRLENNGFLVTASSRAPEITLFGTPRVAVWPIPELAANRTAYDELIAFCSSLNTNSGLTPFYFDRTDAMSASTDISRTQNVQLLNYLNGLMTTTAIPGSSRSGYLSKGGADELAQLQTQVFDYIRCVNLTDTHPQKANTISFSKGSLVMPAVRQVNGTTTRGFGRFYTVNQFGIIFAATANTSTSIPTNATMSNVPENKSLQSVPGVANATLLGADQTRVMPLPVIELAIPAAGAGGVRPGIAGGISLSIRNLSSIRVNASISPWQGVASSNLGNLPDSSTYNIAANLLSKNVGGPLFHTTPLRTIGGFKPMRAVNGFSGPSSGYPVGEAFTVPAGSIMTVSSASPILIDIIAAVNPTEVVTVEIPPFSTTVRAPNLLSTATAWSWHSEGIGITDPAVLSTRLLTPSTFNPANKPIDSRTNFSLTTFLQPGANLSATSTIVSLGMVFENESSPLSANKSGDSVVALATKHGDFRMVMTRPEQSNDNFSVVPTGWNSRYRHRFFSPFSRHINFVTGDIRPASSVNNWDVPGGNAETRSMGIMKPRGNSYQSQARLPTLADYPAGTPHPRDWGDFDNGHPLIPDGPYINKPDEGEIYGTGGGLGFMPYFGQNTGESIQIAVQDASAIAWASPSREIASPVAFGSLPSGSLLGRPWQNLLFRPTPTGASATHPGSAGFKWSGASDPSAPPDHYLLDFFWMPTVEPIAISERFATAGKINLNNAIAPFSYIQRSTALHALLMNEMMPTVSSIIGAGGWNSNGYSKLASHNDIAAGTLERMIDIPATLEALAAKRGPSLFTSSSQICEVPLIPRGPNGTPGPGLANIDAFWNNNRMTGDNLRELPYNNIYQRITTKSNSYTVHYRVQVLKKVPGGDPKIWREGTDKAVSEHRGSTLMERYLDPNASFPDYLTQFDTAPSMETLYRFRILQRTTFAP